MGPARFNRNRLPGLPLCLAVLHLPLIVLAVGCQSASSAPKDAAAECPVIAAPEPALPLAPALPLRRYCPARPDLFVPRPTYPVIPFRAVPAVPPRIEPRDFGAPSAPQVFVFPSERFSAMSPFEPPRVRIVPNGAVPSVPMPTTPGPRGVQPVPLLEMHGYPGGNPPVSMPALDSSSAHEISAPSMPIVP